MTHPATVAEFRRFVKATCHVTLAERPLDPADYPGALPELLVPGALVFQGTRGPVPLSDYRQWWAYVLGAKWDAPDGLGSDTRGRDRNPATQMAHEDALAYAAWAGKTCPVRPSGSSRPGEGSTRPHTPEATSSHPRRR